MFPLTLLVFFVFCSSFFITVGITWALNNVYSSFFIAFFLFTLSINACVYVFSKKRILFIALFGVFWIFLGSILTYLQLHDIEVKKQVLEPYFVSRAVEVKAKVLGLYKQTDHDNVYLLEVLSLNKNSTLLWWMKFQATFDRNLDISEGNILSFSSQIYPIRWEESYVAYFTSQWIYFRTFPISFVLEGQYPSFFLFQKIWELRMHLIGKMNEFFPHNESIFLAGILLGARESIDTDILNSFNNAGLTHVIAVSGFNITILLLFFWFLFSYTPPLFRIILLGGIITFFVFLVWFSPSVLRAAFMWIIAYIVTLSWRQVNVYALLSFVLLGFVLYNPLSLLCDISLQLSFLAVLGVILFYALFEKVFFFLPKFFALRESIVMTLSATITTLPIMLLNFWKFSLVAPFSNLLVGWSIPFAMFGWFFTIISSYFFDFLAKLSAFLTYLFLRYDIEIVQFFWWLSWSTFSFDVWNFSGFFLVSYFIWIWFLYMLFKPKEA